MNSLQKTSLNSTEKVNLFLSKINENSKSLYIIDQFFQEKKSPNNIKSQVKYSYSFIKINNPKIKIYNKLLYDEMNLNKILKGLKFIDKTYKRFYIINIIKNLRNKQFLKSDIKNISSSTKNSSTASGTKYTEIYNNKISINFEFSKKNYCNYYPKKDEMKNNSDKKPLYFPLECFHGVNQSHNEIGNKMFLNLNENNICDMHDSYKVIDRKDHILLNHLCQNKKREKKIITSITVKFRHKNTTFIYYKQ